VTTAVSHNTTVWLSCDDVVQIYEQAIHAGPLLDRGKLEAAVAAPLRGFGGIEFYPTLEEKAARLIFEVCQAHAFLDGNKRLAWLCGVLLLGFACRPG